MIEAAVVDSSVALKWVVEEPDTPQAENLATVAFGVCKRPVEEGFPADQRLYADPQLKGIARPLSTLQS